MLVGLQILLQSVGWFRAGGGHRAVHDTDSSGQEHLLGLAVVVVSSQRTDKAIEFDDCIRADEDSIIGSESGHGPGHPGRS